MTEVSNEKPLEEVNSSHHSVGDELTTYSRPAGFRYRTFKIGKYESPWIASPLVQLIIVAFVCFLCPGMFNALSGMGGGGQVDAHAADNANVALYSTFAVVGK